jgi:hypothetical protein
LLGTVRYIRLIATPPQLHRMPIGAVSRVLEGMDMMRSISALKVPTILPRSIVGYQSSH